MSVATWPEQYRRLKWEFRRRVLRQRRQKARINGYDMWLDLRVEGVSRALAIRGSREEDKTELMRRELKPGMVHFDLGANIGYYALLAADLVGPTGRIFCIEPDPRNLEFLRANVELNQLSDRVEVVAAAASDRPGRATMYQTAASNLNTLVDPASRSGRPSTESPVSVDVVTMDEFMAARGGVINFLRMDIEGFEVEALRGGMQTLKRSPAPCKILLETHPQMYGPGRDFGAVLESLFGLGFSSIGLVSAGSARPEAFVSRGYAPDELFEADGFTRGYYKSVKPNDAIQLCTSQPKAVRYLLLKKI